VIIAMRCLRMIKVILLTVHFVIGFILGLVFLKIRNKSLFKMNDYDLLIWIGCILSGIMASGYIRSEYIKNKRGTK
jgi:hypothetical protein